ncbi:MAG: hypothetical protein DHS20C14_20450 [Phycisphaeraceae bacterium]|nr:MAG: hypothetical protein DHS20C14_20450 [Phycisphaeraceae bacterium]
MKKAIAIAAVAGLAGTAAAQTIHITADVTCANPSDTITWTVSVTGLTAQTFVQAYDFNLNASGDFGTASAFSDGLSAIVNPQAGAGLGASLLGANGGQSTTLDFLGTVFGDIVIGTFTVHAESEGFLSYSLSDGGVLGANIVRTRQGSDFGPINFDGNFAVESDSVKITPTPASAALLGLGGLVALRRRR